MDLPVNFTVNLKKECTSPSTTQSSAFKPVSQQQPNMDSTCYDERAATMAPLLPDASTLMHPLYIHKIFNFQNMFLFSNPPNITAANQVQSTSTKTEKFTNDEYHKRPSDQTTTKQQANKIKKKIDFSIESILSMSSSSKPVRSQSSTEPQNANIYTQQPNSHQLSMCSAQRLIFNIQQQQQQQKQAQYNNLAYYNSVDNSLPSRNQTTKHSHRQPNYSHKGQTTYASEQTKTIEVPRHQQHPVAKVKNAKKYKCDLCGRGFSRSNTLITHRRIHTGEKPFECNICGRAFRQPGNLTRHKLTHTTIKPYSCNKCGKSFNRVSNLHAHIKIHTDGKPFMCVVCGTGFFQKIDLKLHTLTHSANMNKINECNVCERKFKQASHLKYHLHSHLKQLNDKKCDANALTNMNQDQRVTMVSANECKQTVNDDNRLADDDDENDEDELDDDDVGEESVDLMEDHQDDNDTYSSSLEMSLEQSSEFM